MVSPLLALLLGVVIGAALTLAIARYLLGRKLRSEPAHKSNPAAFFETLLGRKIPPAPKRPEVAAMPRSAGSWRRQKAALERSHNSKQKGPQYRAL